MGQGFSVSTLSAAAAGIDVPELADLRYEKTLHATRFMKAVRARQKDGLVVAKVVVKPWPSLKFDPYIRILLDQRKALAEVPNALAYHRIIETSQNGYLVRQYIHSSLYDRMSTRPFLEDIEKKWIAFQLLCAVRDCHARNIYHGDIKTENVLVTSWNWLYLTDFSSSFKPTYLPEDDPAEFSFFFDTSGRRTCYLAPERFLSSGTKAEGEGSITWAMDVFSVGCVIAELFLEAPIFSLSQIFKYRQNEYDPSFAHLSKIRDENVRTLVSHMINIDPEKRLQADEYLTFWKGKAFPHYFYGFLQQYMHSITDPSSGRKPVTSEMGNLGECDDRIDQIYNDFDKISILLAGGDGSEPNKPQQHPQKANGRLFPLWIDIPNCQHQASPRPELSLDDGHLIFLNIIVSSLRGIARASARIRACELLLAFGESITDEAKLDRVVPHLTNLLLDRSDLVRAAALRTLTQVLALVTVVSPINAYVFPQWLLPRLRPFVPGPNEHCSSLLRMTYASCMGTLAITANRYLNLVQALREDGSLPTSDPEAEGGGLSLSTHQHVFDADHDDLVLFFEAHTKALLTDADSSVRRAMLGSVLELCVFFESTKTNDVVLSHLNTYLNDRDWMLKCAFFDTIVGVAIFVGAATLEVFILPLMIQALTDPEEFVVEKVLRAFSSMAENGLFARARLWELVDIVARLTMHPNIWVREAAAQLISTATKYLAKADVHSIMVALIKPYLKVLPADFSESRLLDALKKPLPRLVLERASHWALVADRGLFWVPAKQQRTFSFGATEETLPTISGRELDPKLLQKQPRNDEDENWLKQLRSAGMSSDDEFKLVALREFIWRVAHRRRKDAIDSSPSKFNHVVKLTELNIIPQTVMFENSQATWNGLQDKAPPQDRNIDPTPPPRTITDALLDASTTEDDVSSRRRTSHADTHADRFVRATSGGERSPHPIPLTSVPSPSGTPAGNRSPSVDGDMHRASLQIPSSAQGSIGSPSPTGLSPVGSVGGVTMSDHGHAHGLRHKGSSISLLNKMDNKAVAETGTTSANAIGRVDATQMDGARSSRPKSQLAIAQERQRRSPSRIRYREAHNYKGNDPSVLKLLDSLYLEHLPVDRFEFGPEIQQTGRRGPIKRRDGATTSSAHPWKPEGVLVAMFSEHTAAVNRVLVAADQSFFITGSDDGTVKVWDASRLERNVSRRSRQTFRLSESARVSSLVFIENTYCFVCTGTDGSVSAVKVDVHNSGNQTKFGRLQHLREHQLPEGEYATWSDHFNNDNQSVLILATNKSRVIAFDLRTMKEIWTLENPVHHGVPGCFCVDRRHHWLLLGTSHGVLDLWDLRFKLLLRSWSFQGASPIHRIVLSKSRKTRVYVAGGSGQGEVTLWDLEKPICKEVYRTAQSKDIGSKTTTLIDLDEEKAGGMLGRFATSLEPTANTTVDRGVRALVLGLQSDENGDNKQMFLLTAGPDWKVRFWDTARYETSMVVSGLELEDAKPTYRVDQPSPDTIIVTEKSLPPMQQGSVSSGRESRASSNSPAKRGGNKPPRSSLISQQQQHLLRSHLDTIMDVALLENPYGMVISVDRSGLIYLFM